MPPNKKRGRPAKAATATTAATPTKSTRATAPIITTNRGKEIEATAAASRPKRDTAATAPAAPVQKKSTTKKRAAPKAAEESAPKRGPGRPKKVAPTPAKATVKKRGRPSKASADAAEGGDENEDQDEEPAEEQEPPKKKQRGRPPKTKAQDADDEPPAKQAPTPAKRGLGRPRKKLEPAVPEEETAPPKARDHGETTRMPGDDVAAADQLEDELRDTAESPEQSTIKRKGKAPISKKGKGKAAQHELPEDSDAVVNGEVDEGASGKNYWLMKAEEKGHDIPLPKGGVFNTTFTIDDLRSKTEPEAWDGVRSHAAAKNMRDMKKGDLAFFYASGGKNPGIVGIMEIVKEHEPDATQFDEDGPNYEQKDQARGKWCVVHVEFRKKLNPPVYRHALQEHLNDGPLGKMQEFTAARLSVSKVSEAEWKFITESLIQGYDDGDADATAALPTAPKGPQGPEFPGGIEESEEATRNDSVAEAKAISKTTNTAVTAVMASTEAEPMMTDIPDATSATSRPPSRAASRQPSAKGTSSRIASRANSLAPPDGRRARSRTTTPKATAASVVQESALAIVTEEEAPPIEDVDGFAAPVEAGFAPA